MKRKEFFSAKKLTGMGVLLTLIIVLQTFGSYFTFFGTPLSFVLVPIVLAGLLYGPLEGGILGVAFGIVVLIQAISGVDQFTLALLQEQPFWTVMLCLVKGAAAGVGAGFAYKWVGAKNKHAGVFSAAAAAPILNTGLFILGALCFLQEALAASPDKTGYTGGSIIYYLVIVIAGVNFLVELAINLIFAPSLYRVVNIIEKNFGGGRRIPVVDNGETVEEVVPVVDNEEDEEDEEDEYEIETLDDLIEEFEEDEETE